MKVKVSKTDNSGKLLLQALDDNGNFISWASKKVIAVASEEDIDLQVKIFAKNFNKQQRLQNQSSDTIKIDQLFKGESSLIKDPLNIA